MPLYDFECECGWSDELILKLSEYSPTIKCPQCGGEAKQVILRGHGASLREWPVWLGENKEGHRIRSALQSSRLVRLGKAERLETRSQHDRICREKGFERLQTNDELAG